MKSPNANLKRKNSDTLHVDCEKRRTKRAEMKISVCQLANRAKLTGNNDK